MVKVVAVSRRLTEMRNRVGSEKAMRWTLFGDLGSRLWDNDSTKANCAYECHASLKPYFSGLNHSFTRTFCTSLAM